MPLVGIIGIAGRGYMMENVTPDMFERMQIVALEAMADFGLATSEVELVSGGAPVADHVAIALFKTGKFERLQLHLPAHWNKDKGQYADTKHGAISNVLHRDFSHRAGLDSLSQLNEYVMASPQQNVQIFYYDGFFQRNDAIARDSEYLIALGFEKEMTEGSKYTYSKCQGQKVYVTVK